jgi:hypothetical protein
LSSRYFEYDIAISFAGEQRVEAEDIARCLTGMGVSVFYDKYEEAGLWGKNLYDHLSDVYQNKCRYCLMLVSTAYATKVWTNFERESAQARALSQKTEYILPVRFDGTEIPGLPSTVGYLRFQDHQASGICSILLQKLSKPDGLSTRADQRDLPLPTAYLSQLSSLPNSAIMQRIWSKPHWRICIRPTEFKSARFQNLDACREFVRSNAVRGGAHPFPPSSTNAIEQGNEWIAYDLDFPGTQISRLEHWVLFRSGQFIDNRAFDEIPALGERIHVFEILDTVTGVFEFAAAMARSGILAPEAAISFELHNVAGCELTWPQENGGLDGIRSKTWCEEERIILTRQLDPEDLKMQKRKLALEVATEIYNKYGWLDPPTPRLTDEQRQRFDFGR